MQLGIFAKTFEGKTPDSVLQQVKAAGFDVAQYNMACSGLAALPDEVSDEVINAIAEASRTTGVRLNALSATYNMIHPDLNQREQGHRRLAAMAKTAKALDIRLLTLCTGTRDAADQWKHHPDNDSTEAWRDLLQSMQIALGIADEFDVDLGIEPELANVINSASKARRLLDEVRSPRLKIVFDPANLFERESVAEQRRIVASALELLSGDIAMAHAKDRNATGDFVAAGTGVLDYGHFLRVLMDVGFKGPLITHGLTAAEAPSVHAFLLKEIVKLGLSS